ncbi:MAG: hypothetical protein WCK75_06995 [Elusimicrobiota bacterium]
MTQENEGGSLFSKYKKAPKPQESAAPAEPIPAKQPEPPSRQAEAGNINNTPSAKPLPTPGSGSHDLTERLERAESVIAGLRKDLAAQREVTAAYLEQSASKSALKTADLKISDLMSAVESVKRSIVSEGAMALRLERSESAVAELKMLVRAQQAQFERSVAGMAHKEALDAVKLGLSEALTAFEGMKKNISEYSGEFFRIESECHKSLGEMQGHARNIEQKFAGEGFDEYLKESVSRLSAKLSEVEKGMHAAIADMSGRLTTSEVLSKKILMEAEDRVKKGVEPEMKALEGETKWLRDNVVWLMDEYRIVMERKIRALEGKYSAFEAISKRMDTISETLDKNPK